MTLSKPKAIVLLSGGLDSTTVLAIARQQGFELYALTFRYGQRHELEIEAARQIACHFGVAQHIVAEIDLRVFGGSALTSDIAVPKGRDVKSGTQSIPITYVPARNTIFLSFALAWAEVLEATNIFIGINAVDYSGYPDCRPEYLEAFTRMAKLATKTGVERGDEIMIHAPLLHLSKGQIIQRGLELGVDYSLTRSCYDPDPSGKGCGTCDACLLRIHGFSEVGMKDPLPYLTESAS